MFEFPFVASHINTITFQAFFAVLACAKYNCLTVKQCFQVYLRNIGNFGFGVYLPAKNLRSFLSNIPLLYAARFLCLQNEVQRQAYDSNIESLAFPVNKSHCFCERSFNSVFVLASAILLVLRI